MSDKSILMMKDDRVINAFRGQLEALKLIQINRYELQKYLTTGDKTSSGHCWIFRVNLDEYMNKNTVTKVCKNPGCSAEGARQSITNFRLVKKGSESRAGDCKACISKANNNLIHGQTVKVLGNDHYKINHIDYKIGLRGWLFYIVCGEWVRSANDVDWLMRKVRLYAQV